MSNPRFGVLNARRAYFLVALKLFPLTCCCCRCCTQPHAHTTTTSIYIIFRYWGCSKNTPIGTTYTHFDVESAANVGIYNSYYPRAGRTDKSSESAAAKPLDLIYGACTASDCSLANSYGIVDPLISPETLLKCPPGQPVKNPFSSSSPASPAASLSLAAGALAGIIIGAICFLILCPILVVILCCGGVAALCGGCCRGSGNKQLTSSPAATTTVIVIPQGASPGGATATNNPLHGSHQEPPTTYWRTGTDGHDTW